MESVLFAMELTCPDTSSTLQRNGFLGALLLASASQCVEMSPPLHSVARLGASPSTCGSSRLSPPLSAVDCMNAEMLLSSRSYVCPSLFMIASKVAKCGSLPLSRSPAQSDLVVFLTRSANLSIFLSVLDLENSGAITPTRSSTCTGPTPPALQYAVSGSLFPSKCIANFGLSMFLLGISCCSSAVLVR